MPRHGGAAPSQEAVMKITTFAILALAAIPLFTSAVTAQDARPLSSDDIKNMLVGKKLEHVRLSDNKVFVWDVTNKGTVFVKGYSAKAKWTLGDNGQFCTAWNIGQIKDQCYYFYQSSAGLSAGNIDSPGVMTSRVRVLD
jgi:hypothetical protein